MSDRSREGVKCDVYEVGVEGVGEIVFVFNKIIRI